ncbi:condensation domain-containing protein [Micromonospora sp. KLBMP9576]|uniref:condensation domain-containing protein n=1 Tax=Micromonospora sp. KLBMP9576 TaxID=3424769 RepID=UPI003D94000B
MARPSDPEVQFQDSALGGTRHPTAPETADRQLAPPSPPRTPYEEVVHGIWGDVLGDLLEPSRSFGVHDDFFELGGHSLLAPKIVARIRRTLGVQIPVRELFGCRTVAALAAVAAAQASGAAPAGIIERQPPGTPSVLSFDQQRLWLENQLLPSLAYNVHGRQKLRGPLNTTTLETSIRAILHRHESLRTRFPTINGQPMQVVDDPDPHWTLDVHDVSTHPDPTTTAHHLADTQATTPFNLATDNLIRCQLIKTNHNEHILTLTAHHIVCDDWSIGLFTRELTALYTANGDPHHAGLDPLPIQYRDYATWQRHHLTGQQRQKTIDYWRTHLTGAPPVLTMPVAHRGDGKRVSGRWARGRLSEEETAALRVLCRTRGVSPFMVMMTALSVVLARWSGQRDLVIGVPTAGRTEAGTDTLIGFLVNTLPIRVDLSGEPTFAELLTRVRQVCLDGYAHSDAPLDVLVQEVELSRDTRHTPLFQVVLSMLNTAGATPQLPGIEVEQVDGATELPAKLDLTVNVHEQDRRFHLQLDYNPRRYDPAMVDALVGHLETLLRTAITDPERGILDYELGPTPTTDTPPTPDVTTPEPHQTAIVTPTGSTTYAELTAPTLPTNTHLGITRETSTTFVTTVLTALTTDTPFTILDPHDTLDPALLGVTTVLDTTEPGTEPPHLDRLRPWIDGLTPGDRVGVLTHDPDLLVAAITNTFAAGATLFLAPGAVNTLFLSPPQLRALTAPLPELTHAYLGNTPDLLPHDIDHLRRLAPNATITTLHTAGAHRAAWTVPATWTLADAPPRVPLGVVPGHTAAVGEVTTLGSTGEPVRLWADGVLHPATDQVVDPAETAGALRDLPDVRDAVVLESAGPDGEPFLVAYVSGAALTRRGSEIRQELVLRLPDYLTPQRLFVLDELPRTAYGDYDLDAFPQALEGTSAGKVPPRTPHEEIVHGIWCDVLGVSGFGVHDDFFELGGHSLLVPRIVGRIRETLGVQIPVGDFFGSRTVAALASVAAGQSVAAATVIERGPREAASALSFGQQRLWLENQLLPSLAYNVHGRQKLRGPLNTTTLETSIRAILHRHESLRTRFPTINGQPMQVVDDPDPHWTLDVHDVSTHPDPTTTAHHLADTQATTPFNLATDNLIRCQLIKTNHNEHILTLTAHHIVCDDWSIGLFTRELTALYTANGDPHHAGLDPLPIQYRDYATWQRHHLTGQQRQKTIDYWRTHLTGAPPALALPVARERGAAREAGDRVRSFFGPDETTALLEFCRARGVSPFMLVAAALSTVLARWSGQRDLVIGVPVAGRTEPGTDALIGFLLNTLPIRIDLSGEPTFAELLTRVRQVCLDGYAHSDAPLDVLVQEVDVVRDPRRTPLFQVVLNVVGDAVPTQLAGVTVEPMETLGSLPTKFDLSLNVQQSESRTYLQLDYDPRRYDPAMVDALVGHLETLLRTAITDPERGILDYELGPTPTTDTPPTPAVTTPEPHQTAIVTPTGSTTYAELTAPTLPTNTHLGITRETSTTFVTTVLTALTTDTPFTILDPHDTLDPALLGVTTVLDTTEPGTEPPHLDRLRPWIDGLTPGDRVGVLTHDPDLLVAAIVHTLAAGATLDLAGTDVTAVFLSPPQLRALDTPLPHLTRVYVDNTPDLLPHDIAHLRGLAPGATITAVHTAGTHRATWTVPATWTLADAPPRVPLGVVPGHTAAVGEVTTLGDTGRPARLWADGVLHRATGHTVDPAETAGALRDLPDVTDALVVRRTGPDGEAVFVAHVAGPEPDEDTGIALRQSLVPRLPEFLVPAHVFVLDRLPRTPLGDYDLDALPQWDPDGDDDGYVAPRTPLERRLVEIFEEVLELERIGVHDSFFELNGFSLLATQMTSRIRETFEVELPLREVFGAPTVQGLAQLILWKQSERSDAAQLEAILAGIEAQ